MSESRESWDNRFEFLLACIGSAVGLGNIWRFPYLCYKAGGGAFLIPYFIMLIFCGLPLLFMELSIGQYTRRGPVGAIGKMVPILKGTGVATVVMSFLLSSYYNVILAWAFTYFKSSFQDPLPWTGCGHPWNTDKCWDISNPDPPANGSETSSQEFYDHYVLKVSSGIQEMGSLNYELLGWLLLAWVLVYFCIWKSVKATGKVVYFTACFPYLLLFIFLGRAVTLPGAEKGIMYFINPKWELLLEAKVWVLAAAQVFNSIGIAFGGLIVFSSYNKFHGPVFRDALIITFVDSLTCIICGFCVFSTMGNLAHEQGKNVDQVVTEGPGLVFVVFPHALSKLPIPQLWSAIFFGMLLLLGVDSQFATVEVVVTSVKDSMRSLVDKSLKRHELVVLAVCICSFIVGIPNLFQGGIYFFQIMDYFSCAISLMYIAFFEVIAILWIYGVPKLTANIKDMTGYYPNWFFTTTWRFVSPILIFGIWMFSIVDYKPPTYNNGAYIYPDWAIGLGWIISSLSLIPIPVFVLYQWITSDGDTILKKLEHSLKSTIKACPCGCENELDDSNFEAHSNKAWSSSLGLYEEVKGCSKDEEEGK